MIARLVKKYSVHNVVRADCNIFGYYFRDSVGDYPSYGSVLSWLI